MQVCQFFGSLKVWTEIWKVNGLNYIRKSTLWIIHRNLKNYAVKHRRISSNTLNAYTKHQVTNLTPNIIEERPMNVAVMDVYSRLMMDRIIFLGYPDQ